ncbi:hypothetical protein N7492_006129 [Penicillium capsulatum]|uniref:OTU domain-containing protein n=1 Tax=Penicillium capsulatum TaxID=69766 RepID=A0A9W9LMP3_9EURO|nr:hypothetical protein N7492_006129 [Penicillium capsulatum]KAJ6108779.1 hypothetical protein N7512_008616 [Penicillium capsulatum]
MALARSGRIVPILAGREQTDSTPGVHSPGTGVMAPQLPQSLLLGQQGEGLTGRNKATDDASLKMPCLREHGLFALPTLGDGNCLYYSLSDQLYADFDHGDEIRQRLADHMAAHKQYFMQFVVAEGADKERRFDEMVAATRKNGEWGSSEHLQAFCQVFRVDMKVYTMDGVQMFRDVNASPDEDRDVIHVAFHDFKHYSSVRVINGCHAGLFAKSKCVEHLALEPQFLDVVKKAPSDHTLSDQAVGDPKEPTLSTANPPEDSTEPVLSTDHPPVDLKETTSHPDNSSSTTETASNTDQTSFTADTALSAESGLAVEVFAPWDIQSIQDGLGGRYDHDTIVDMLQKCRGDIDRAFAALLGEKHDGPGEKKLGPGPNIKPSLQVSRSSSPFSTGSKRSADDSEDSEDPRPPVRRVRPKRQIVSNLTFGVDISFRDDQNEKVSLNLQMKANAEKSPAEKADAEETTGATDSAAIEAPEQADSKAQTVPRKGLRRSGRHSKSRTISPGP